MLPIRLNIKGHLSWRRPEEMVQPITCALQMSNQDLLVLSVLSGLLSYLHTLTPVLQPPQKEADCTNCGLRNGDVAQ